MGGALGAAFGALLPGQDIALWATVGMAAMLGGTMRAPFTATIFTLETTHDLGVLTAVFLASIAAMTVTVLWLPRSILTEKVARRGVHVAREYGTHPLEAVGVAEIMVPWAHLRAIAPWATVEAATGSLADSPLAARIEPPPAPGVLPGIVSAAAVRTNPAGPEKVRPVAAPERPLGRIAVTARARAAVEAMARTGVAVLLVTEKDGTPVGIVRQVDLLKAWRRHLAEEEDRSRPSP
jgi:CBS domain-containing protein